MRAFPSVINETFLYCGQRVAFTACTAHNERLTKSGMQSTDGNKVKRSKAKPPSTPRQFFLSYHCCSKNTFSLANTLKSH